MQFSKTFIAILIVLCPFLTTPIAHAASAKYSLKKGVGMAMLPSECTTSACRQNFMSKLKDLGITWAYNWGTPPEKYSWWDNAVEYVPMVWGAGSGAGGKYTAKDLEYVISFANLYKGSDWLIWNEPNYYKQSNISAQTAASIYKQLTDSILAIDPNAKFIVGGVAWMDLTWLNDFREEYKNIHGVYPKVTGWAIHHYEDANYSHVVWRNTINTAKQWLIDTKQTSKEIWLTEFGSLASNGIGIQILQDQIEWMEQPEQSWITRYAWFFAGVAGTAGEMKGDLFQGSLKDSTFALNYMGLEYAKHPINPTYTPPPSTPKPTKVPTPTPTPIPTIQPAPPPNTPTPTTTILPSATPSPVPTPSFPQGLGPSWNQITLSSDTNTSSLPNCYTASKKTNSIWLPWSKYQTSSTTIKANQKYLLRCNFQ